MTKMLQENIEDDNEVEVKEMKVTIQWLIVVKKVKKEEDKVNYSCGIRRWSDDNEE